MGPPESGFMASAFLQRRLAHRRARGKPTDLGCPRKPSLPPSAGCEIAPRHLPLSYRSLSSGTRLGLNSNGTAKIFHAFRQRLHSTPNRLIEHCKRRRRDIRLWPTMVRLKRKSSCPSELSLLFLGNLSIPCDAGFVLLQTLATVVSQH